MPVSDLEDYIEKRRYKEGLARCNKLLKKSNVQPILHIYKARFLRGLGQHEEAKAALAPSLELKLTINDTQFIHDFDIYMYEDLREHSFPNVLTNGIEANKLWSNVLSTTSRQIAVAHLNDRYTMAIVQSRWIDVSYALTTWRKLEPDRLDLRFMHVVIYQLVAESSQDPMTAMMNSKLAQRTIEQLINSITTEAQLCLVLDVLSSQKAHDQIIKLIYEHDAIYKLVKKGSRVLNQLVTCLENAQSWQKLKELTTLMLDPSQANEFFEKSDRIEVSRTNWSTWASWLRACRELGEPSTWPPKRPYLELSEESRISILIDLWTARHTENLDELCKHIKTYFELFGHKTYCYSDLKDSLQVTTESDRSMIVKEIDDLAANLEKAHPDYKKLDILICRMNAVKIRYILTIAAVQLPALYDIFAIVGQLVDIFEESMAVNRTSMPEIPSLLVSALLRAQEVDPNGEYTLLAAEMLTRLAPRFDYHAYILRSYIYGSYGLSTLAIKDMESLNIREIQRDTISHVTSTRLSITYPFGGQIMSLSQCQPKALLTQNLSMYEMTIDRLAEQQYTLLQSARSDMMLELTNLRRVLTRSLNRRLMILELRRRSRLTNTLESFDHNIYPNTIDGWSKNLEDYRDYNVCEKFDIFNDFESIERRLHHNCNVPNQEWIYQNLRNDQLCCLINGTEPLIGSILPESVNRSDSKSMTVFEKKIQPFWDTLADVTAHILQIRSMPNKTKDEDVTDDLTVHLLDKLIPQDMLSRSDNASSLQPVECLQSIYLIADLLKAIYGLTTAIQDINSGKRKGLKTSGKCIEPVRTACEKHLAHLQDFAKKQVTSFDAHSISLSLAKTWAKVYEATSKEANGTRDMKPKTFSDARKSNFWIVGANFIQASAKDAWLGVAKLQLGNQVNVVKR